MKKILTVFALATLTACSSLTPAEKAAEEAKIASQVENALTERHYKITINRMNPRRGPSVSVSNDFSLEVKGDTLISYLPYFGRAYSIPYGGGKGLNFTAPIKDYQEEKGHKDGTLIRMTVDNEEDLLTFNIEVFSNGNTTIDLTMRDKESISYSGEMDLEPTR